MKSRSDLIAGVGVFAGSLALYLSFSALTRPLGKDPATWDMMATFLPHGLVPYRDIFLHKTPGAALLGSVGASVAEAIGATPVLGAHFLFLLVAALAPALLFWLCRTRMPLLPSLAAAAFLLAFDQWLLPSIEGVRPKVATTTFGLACLLAAARGRPILAGSLGSLAAICWQPGVAFLCGAAWELVARDRSRAARILTRVAVGAAIPGVALLAGFAAVGGLGDLFEQAVLFNRHYVDVHSKSVAQSIRRLRRLMWSWSPTESWLFVVGAIGLVLPLQRRTGISAPPGLVISGILYVGLTFVSLQGWPDTILLAAPAAGLMSAGLVRLLHLAVDARRAGLLVLAAALVCVALPRRPEVSVNTTFSEQADLMDKLAGRLDDDDTVVVIGTPEFSIHTGRLSVWPWPYMWFGVDRFAAAKSEGGFTGMLERLDERRPGLILVARSWHSSLRSQFECWLAPRYKHTRLSYWPHVGGRHAHAYRPRKKVDASRAEIYQQLGDIEVRSVRLAATRAEPGEPLDVSLRVTNPGCNATPETDLRFFLSVHARRSHGDLELVANDGAQLRTARMQRSGEWSERLELAAPLPSAAAPALARRLRAGKPVYLHVVADAADEVMELDETNNSGFARLVVRGRRGARSR